MARRYDSVSAAAHTGGLARTVEEWESLEASPDQSPE
jgi:hypothetical protein